MKPKPFLDLKSEQKPKGILQKAFESIGYGVAKKLPKKKTPKWKSASIGIRG